MWRRGSSALTAGKRSPRNRIPELYRHRRFGHPRIRPSVHVHADVDRRNPHGNKHSTEPGKNKRAGNRHRGASARLRQADRAISPLGWQLEERFMRRYAAARNCPLQFLANRPLRFAPGFPLQSRARELRAGHGGFPAVHYTWRTLWGGGQPQPGAAAVSGNLIQDFSGKGHICSFLQ